MVACILTLKRYLPTCLVCVEHLGQYNYHGGVKLFKAYRHLNYNVRANNREFTILRQMPKVSLLFVNCQAKIRKAAWTDQLNAKFVCLSYLFALVMTLLLAKAK